jgi:hypothetical protein
LQTLPIARNLHRVIAWEWSMWNEQKFGAVGDPRQVNAMPWPYDAFRSASGNSNRKIPLLEYDPTH